MTSNPSRLRFAAHWAFSHLLISLIVAALAAVLVFGLWYPAPWRQMLGVASLFGLIVLADVVCGPLLTLVLASPKKSQRERLLDISLVALIQLGALGYGLFSVYGARPVVLAFEVDRLVVVTANEVQVEQLPQAPKDLQVHQWSGVRHVALRKAMSNEEFFQSVDGSLQGVTPAMRPERWRPFAEASAAMALRAKPLEGLLRKLESRAFAGGSGSQVKAGIDEALPMTQLSALNKSIASTGLHISALRYLPLTSSKNREWVALLNAATEVVGYAPVDGFDDE